MFTNAERIAARAKLISFLGSSVLPVCRSADAMRVIHDGFVIVDHDRAW
jgi:hypothetical protein